MIYLKTVLTTESRSQFYKVSRKPGFDGLVEHSGAVDNCFAPSKARCTTSCSENLRCVSFFYNLETMECVMHSKEFHSTFTLPSNSGKGWRYYVAQDVTGRCPQSWIYYRPLQFCYNIDSISSIDFPEIKEECKGKGGKLAAIESREKQDYFNHFLAGRPINRFCIAGERNPPSPDNWVFDDGTSLTYFNWYTDQPNSAYQKCISVKATRLMGDAWFDCACVFTSTTSCMYVCDI